jgi:hypothetical protein
MKEGHNIAPGTNRKSLWNSINDVVVQTRRMDGERRKQYTPTRRSETSDGSPQDSRDDDMQEFKGSGVPEAKRQYYVH